MNLKTNSNKWYKDWFNASYYHILYQDRDYSEAQRFIKNLIKVLVPPKNSTIVDIACGKGRHAIQLASLGYQVDGFDLSENSISEAKKFESSNLKFFINDMRNPLKEGYYDYAFNLFTSFGYFNDKSENQKALTAISKSLKPKGSFVLDYLNANKVISTLPEQEEKLIDGIKFTINKSYLDGNIVKNIKLNDNNVESVYQEQVEGILLDDFISLFKTANLSIQSIYGDYDLSNFDEKNSDRLIIVASKNG